MARVLIVDDEKDLLSLMSEFIGEDLGHNVVAVESADAAVSALTEPNGIDLMITDYRMPQRDGASLISDTRLTHPELRTILLTGQCSEEIQTSLEAHGTVCLKKPVSFDELESVITEQLRL